MIQRLSSLFRILLITIWFGFICLVGTFYAIIRWGNPNTMSQISRCFGWLALKIARIEMTVEGEENREAHQPCVYIANHQSALDMVNLGISYPKNTVTIGKRELLFIPFFGTFFAAAGNIMIDRSNRRDSHLGLSKAAEQIQSRHVSVGVFPEGTRNRTGKGMLPFKKGAFHIAAQAQVPLIPIVTSPLSLILDRKTGVLHGGKVTVAYLPPIRITDSSKESINRTAVEARETMLRKFEDLEKRT